MKAIIDITSTLGSHSGEELLVVLRKQQDGDWPSRHYNNTWMIELKEDRTLLTIVGNCSRGPVIQSIEDFLVKAVREVIDGDWDTIWGQIRESEVVKYETSKPEWRWFETRFGYMLRMAGNPERFSPEWEKILAKERELVRKETHDRMLTAFRKLDLNVLDAYREHYSQDEPEFQVATEVINERKEGIRVRLRDKKIRALVDRAKSGSLGAPRARTLLGLTFTEKEMEVVMR